MIEMPHSSGSKGVSKAVGWADSALCAECQGLELKARTVSTRTMRQPSGNASPVEYWLQKGNGPGQCLVQSSHLPHIY